MQAPVWLYLKIAHALHGKARKLIYRSPVTGDVVIFDHSDVAETLFQNRKYDWCLFIGHLVIEKVLKAFYVRDTGESPPWIHNLVRLAENTTLSLSDKQKQFLMEINRFNSV